MSAQAPDFKPDQLMPGTKYRVVRQIGAGGMGVVYQVVKPPEIQGVLKLMSAELAEHEEFRVRFFDEVRVLAQLDHPNIVKVFDYDSLADGTPYYVMELLHGRTVRDVLATMGTIPAKVAFEIARQLCEALHVAHTNHIPVVHRDIKPENIFLHAPKHGEPVVKLIDFGVVAIADRKHDGTFVGTWKYAAPEQIRGEQAVPATDLYAVGLVLYEMLCGIGPFEQYDTGPLISRAHMFEAPPPVSKFAPWVPPSIVNLIEVTLSKDPRFRPRDAYAFAERLYELEWADDGNAPPSRTAEGPLRRILSNVGPAPIPAAGALPPRNQDIPLIIQPAPKHDGPTLRGVGTASGAPHEGTTPPGEDELLDGLLGRLDATPSPRQSARKARASAPSLDMVDATPRYPNVVLRPMAEAPPNTLASAGTHAPLSHRDTEEAAGEGTTRKIASAGQVTTDTFASNESDARRPARGKGLRVVLLVAALGFVTLAGTGAIVVHRLSNPRITAASPPAITVGEVPPTQTQGIAAATATSTSTSIAPPSPPPPPAVASSAPMIPPPARSAVVPSRGRPRAPSSTTPGQVTTARTAEQPVVSSPPNTPSPPPPAQMPAPKDDSILHTF